jgi:hypothetical protein
MFDSFGGGSDFSIKVVPAVDGLTSLVEGKSWEISSAGAGCHLCSSSPTLILQY